jgi:hypothetical protein
MEYSEANLSNYHFIYHKSHMDGCDIETGYCAEEPTTNPLSYHWAFLRHNETSADN